MSESPEAPKLMPNRMHLAEHERNIHVITVEANITRDQIKDPSFWSLVSSKMRPYDRVELRSDDGMFFAEYLVLACDRSWAKVYELSFHKLTSADISETQAAITDYEIKYRGPQLKHSVIRKSDNTVLKEEMQTRDEAASWLKEHLKAIA